MSSEASTQSSMIAVNPLLGEAESEAAAGLSLAAAEIPVGATPRGVAVAPDGDHVYVTNSGSNTVSVIDTTTNKVSLQGSPSPA